MNLILYWCLILILFSCNNHTENKNIANSTSTKNTDTLKYQFLKDNLYKNNLGDIAFKAIDNTDPRNPKDIFVTSVWNANSDDSIGDGKMEMKNVVDVSSFKRVSGMYYQDKKYFYVFNQMSDGGTFAIIKNIDPKSFIVLSPYYAKDNKHVYYGGQILEKADVKTFKPYPRIENKDTLWQYAKDKNHFYYFGDIIKTDELKSHKLK